MVVFVLHLRSHYPRARMVSAGGLTLTERPTLNAFLRRFITKVATLEGEPHDLNVHPPIQRVNELIPNKGSRRCTSYRASFTLCLSGGRILVIKSHPEV